MKSRRLYPNITLPISLSVMLLCNTPVSYAAMITSSGDHIWASDATGDLSAAIANENIVVNASSVQVVVTNNNTANDGSNGGNDFNTFSIGSISEQTPNSAQVTVLPNENGTGNLSVAIGSIAITNNFTTKTTNGVDLSLTASVSGNVTASNLIVQNDDASTVATTVAGNLTISDGVSIQAGADATQSATLSLSGTTVDVTGGFTLEEQDNGGTAKLIFNKSNGTQTVTGTIDGNEANMGTVEAQGIDVRFSSAIGQNGSLDNFKVISSATAASSATVSQDIAATNFTLDDVNGNVSILKLTGSSQTVTGTINGATANEGSIIIDGTSVTFSGAIGNNARINSFTINADKAATISNALRSTTITNSGTLTIDADLTMGGPDSNTGTITNDGGTLILDAKLTAYGDALNLGTSTISMGTPTYTDNIMIEASNVGEVNADTVTVLPHNTFNDGKIILIWNVANGTAAADKFSAASTIITDYTFEVNNADNLYIVANRKTPAAVVAGIGGKTTISDALALTFAAVDTSTNSTVQNAVIDAILAGGTRAETAAKQLSVNPTQAAPLAALGVTKVVSHTLSARLAEMRQGESNLSQIKSMSLSAVGDPKQAASIWIRPYSYFGTQHEVDSVAGYRTKTFGFAGGMDRPVTDNVRIGISSGYSNAVVDGDGVGENETGINGYHFAFYSDYTKDNRFINGLLGYSNSDVSTSRIINFGGLSAKAIGEYHADQYFMRLEGGKIFTPAPNHQLTPTLTFDYSRFKSDEYTEKDAGVLNLRVKPDAINTALISTGLQYRYQRASAHGSIYHAARMSVGYDIVHEEGVATVKFSNPGSHTFRTLAPDTSPFEGHAGLGIGYMSSDETQQLTLDYDAELREQYLGHGVKLEWRYRF